MNYTEPEALSTPFDDGLTCQQVTALLAEYVDGTLPAQTALALHEHLRDCDACMAFLHTYTATIHLTRALREDDMPSEVQQRLLGFLRSRMSPPPTTSSCSAQGRDGHP